MLNEKRVIEAEKNMKRYPLVESFDNERRKRSAFQYETTDEIKSAKAETSFKRAKEFGSEMEKMIDSIK